MSFGLHLCTQCRNLIRRISMVSEQTRFQYYSTQSGKSNIPKHENEDDGDGIDESLVLTEEAQQFHEDMKAFFPYHTPWRLTEKMALQLNTTHSPKGRINLYYNLNKIEHMRIKSASNDAERKAANQKRMETFIPKPLVFGIPLLRATIHSWVDRKLCHAEMFGPEIVIDCGYEKDLVVSLQRSFVEEVVKMIIHNREITYPFKMVLCNLSEDSKLRDALDKAKCMHTPHFVNLHSESYLDIYDKRELVYLSPDASTSMDEFDPRITYIIGGLPDRGHGQYNKVSLAKARMEKMQCQRLPLHKYNLVRGRIVPMPQMFKLLHLAKDTTMENALMKIMLPRDQHSHHRYSVEEQREIALKNRLHKAQVLRDMWSVQSENNDR